MVAKPDSSPSVTQLELTGVILAIDYGRKRLGLALCDEHGIVPRPFATWKRINRRRDLARLRELVREQGVSRIVVGLPLHLDGTPSEMSQESKAFAARVAKALGISVEMVDERLSTWEAGQMITAANSSRHRKSGSVGGTVKPALDDVAAAIILRTYLNRIHPQAGMPD
jgi:putative holliday junction resolvase